MLSTRGILLEGGCWLVCHTLFFFVRFIYFWVYWVFVAVSGVYLFSAQASQGDGLSYCGAQAPGA